MSSDPATRSLGDLGPGVRVVGLGGSDFDRRVDVAELGSVSTPITDGIHPTGA
jgi:hypothetical protein